MCSLTREKVQVEASLFPVVEAGGAVAVLVGQRGVGHGLGPFQEPAEAERAHPGAHDARIWNSARVVVGEDRRRTGDNLDNRLEFGG